MFETYQLICIGNYTHNTINLNIMDMDKVHFRLRGFYYPNMSNTRDRSVNKFTAWCSHTERFWLL